MKAMQRIRRDEHGIIRFEGNAIVRFLLDQGPHDMNSLARHQFSDADRAQFAELIGYSVSGYGDLDYVSDKRLAKADKRTEKAR